MMRVIGMLGAALMVFITLYLSFGYEVTYRVGYGAFSLLAAMISVTFLWLWRRGNASGAWYGLRLGGRGKRDGLVVDVPFVWPPCGHGGSSSTVCLVVHLFRRRRDAFFSHRPFFRMVATWVSCSGGLRRSSFLGRAYFKLKRASKHQNSATS